MDKRKPYLLLSLLTLIMFACSSAAVAGEVLQRSTGTPGQIPVSGGQSFEQCGGPVIPILNKPFEQAVVEKTNQIRRENGLPPLKYVESLSNSARYHSADMAVNNYFDHNSLHNVNGQMTEMCDTWNRIEKYYSSWEALGENIAAGQRTPDQAIDGWWNSPEHRDNMLSNSYWEIGVGFYEGQGDYRYYWDQNFGRRDGVFPLILDDEKAQTNSATVPVYIYGNFNQVRLRNDDGSWGNWQAFQHEFLWTLPSSPGLHTVEAELSGPDGHTRSSDTIELVPGS